MKKKYAGNKTKVVLMAVWDCMRLVSLLYDSSVGSKQ